MRLLLLYIHVAALSIDLLLILLSGCPTEDDFVVLNSFVALGNQFRQMCFTIQTVVDTVLENTETITIVIDVDSEAPDNVVVQQGNATILISE